jgi:segregation and condensation protein B
MKSLDELPASDVLSSRQIDEWLQKATTAPTPTDTDMGLADEQLPLEGVATPLPEVTEAAAVAVAADEPAARPAAADGEVPAQA